MELPMTYQLEFPGFVRREPVLGGLRAPVVTGEAARVSQETALLRYPDVTAEVLCARAKELGQAAELQLDSTTARLGVKSASFGEHSPFDRVLWIGTFCFRLQIKGRNRSDERGDYRFDIRKGYQRGPTGTKAYEPGDFDLLALVALPENVVKFTARWSEHHVIRRSEIAGLRARPGDSLIAALRDLGVTLDLDPESGAAPDLL
jgi:hypothetical protein